MLQLDVIILEYVLVVIQVITDKPLDVLVLALQNALVLVMMMELVLSFALQTVLVLEIVVTHVTPDITIFLETVLHLAQLVVLQLDVTIQEHVLLVMPVTTELQQTVQTHALLNVLLPAETLEIVSFAPLIVLAQHQVVMLVTKDFMVLLLTVSSNVLWNALLLVMIMGYVPRKFALKIVNALEMAVNLVLQDFSMWMGNVTHLAQLNAL